MKAKYNKTIKNAVECFWSTKSSQRSASADKSNRGAVVGGKQLDGFINLLYY